MKGLLLILATIAIAFYAGYSYGYKKAESKKENNTKEKTFDEYRYKPHCAGC